MRVSTLTMAAGCAIALLGASGPASSQEMLKFAHVYEPASIYHEGALWFAEEIKSRTDGRYEIDVFPSQSLGSENDIFDSLGLGSVDISFTGSFYASTIHGPMALSSAPFMYRDFDHWASYRDSDVFADIASEFEEASDHKVIGLVYYGARHLTANREVRTPEDIRNMKLRVPNNPVYMLFPRAVGANPAPIDFGELYLALQQGVVDGQENPLPTILDKKLYEVQDYIMLTGHMIDSLVTLVAGGRWEAMSDEDRTIFEEVGREAATRITDQVRETEQELAEVFESEHDTAVIEVDREPFREAMMEYLPEADVPWTPEQVEAVQAIE